MNNNLFDKLKINEKLVEWEETYVNIYKIKDIDDDTVYLDIIFTTNPFKTDDYFIDLEINNSLNNFYLLSDIDEENIKDLKNIIFNFILGVDE